MPDKCQNYRTAKDNDIKCPECIYVFYSWAYSRPRCGEFSSSVAVGKTKTCDAAKLRIGRPPRSA